MDLLSKLVSQKHQLILSSYTIDELFAVTQRKFPAKTDVIDTLLSQLPYELVYTPKKLPEGLFEIRDPLDYPVLYSAVSEGIDVFVTGDKDFEDVELEFPEILKPTEFIQKYGTEP